MYNQFCKNLKFYMSIISETGDGSNARGRTAKVLLPLADIDSYLEDKKRGGTYHKKISGLINNLSSYSNVYPTIKNLIWELWAYGFDIGPFHGGEPEHIQLDEVAKLTDLMMSTHYIA
ncbi:MAG TPA: hypothetical protein VF941_06505 [Clostridia bacterium]